MPSVFVIMPLRLDPNVDVKRRILVDIVGDGLILPDRFVDHSECLFDISGAIEKLRSVDLVIADLSFERPSCYFELGMVQAMGIPSFILAETGTRLHQHAGSVNIYDGLGQFSQLVALVMSEYFSGERSVVRPGK